MFGQGDDKGLIGEIHGDQGHFESPLGLERRIGPIDAGNGAIVVPGHVLLVPDLLGINGGGDRRRSSWAGGPRAVTGGYERQQCTRCPEPGMLFHGRYYEPAKPFCQEREGAQAIHPLQSFFEEGAQFGGGQEDGVGFHAAGLGGFGNEFGDVFLLDSVTAKAGDGRSETSERTQATPSSASGRAGRSAGGPRLRNGPGPDCRADATRRARKLASMTCGSRAAQTAPWGAGNMPPIGPANP